MIKIFLVIIYGIIGIFIAGFTSDNDDDKESWILYCIIFWPILCLVFWFYLIFRKFYFLGEKTKEYLNNRSFQKLKKNKDKEKERYFTF